MGFGWLSGLGAEPITVTSNAFQKYLTPFDPQLSWIFVFIPWFLAIACIAIMYAVSKPHWLGLLALFIAFIGGALTFSVNIYLTLLVFVGLALGFVATNNDA